MALRTPRTDLHPSSLGRTVALPLGAQVILADSLEPSNALSPAGAPIAGVNHLPSGMLLSVTVIGTFVFTDIAGNTHSVVAPVGIVWIPFAARTLEVSTATGSVTVGWNLEA